MNNLLRKSTLFPYTTLFRSYEVRMRDTKKEELRRLLFKEKHPLEKLKRIGLGPLTLEGIPRGRYRLIEQKEAEKLRRIEKGREGKEKKVNVEDTERTEDTEKMRRRKRTSPV